MTDDIQNDALPTAASIEKIAELTRAAIPRITDSETLSESEQYAVICPDGTLEIYDNARSRRYDTIYSYDSIIDYLIASPTFDITANDAGVGLSPIVWIENESIRIVLNEGRSIARDDNAVFVNDYSQEYRRLWQLHGNRNDGIDLSAARKLLRVELADALTDEGAAFLKMLGKIKFENSEIVENNRTKSRESIGRSIENEIRVDADEIPDSIPLEVTVYSDPGLVDIIPQRQRVHCQIDVDALSQTVAIIPDERDLMTLRLKAQQAIQSDLMNAISSIGSPDVPDVPVIIGSPA